MAIKFYRHMLIMVSDAKYYGISVFSDKIIIDLYIYLWYNYIK